MYAIQVSAVADEPARRGALNPYHNYDKTYNKQHATLQLTTCNKQLTTNPITSTKKLASCKKWGGVWAGLGKTLSR